VQPGVNEQAMEAESGFRLKISVLRPAGISVHHCALTHNKEKF
jgi:hypothetical protein